MFNCYIQTIEEKQAIIVTTDRRLETRSEMESATALVPAYIMTAYGSDYSTSGAFRSSSANGGGARLRKQMSGLPS